MQAQIKQEGKGNGGGFFKGKGSHLDLKGGKARLVSGEHCSFSTQSRCEKAWELLSGQDGREGRQPKGGHATWHLWRDQVRQRAVLFARLHFLEL